MSGRGLALAVLVTGASCGGDDLPGEDSRVGLRLELSYGVDVGRRGVVARWGGEPGVRGGEHAVFLERTFTNRAAALTTPAPFEVAIAGATLHVESVSFAACEALADVGLPPAAYALTRIRRSFDFQGQTVKEGGISSDQQPVACQRVPGAAGEQVDPDQRRLVYRFRAPRPGASFTFRGEPLLPHVVELGTDELQYELALTIPRRQSARTLSGPLQVTVGGAAATPLTVGFDKCLGREREKDLLIQRQDLTIGGGALMVDSREGFTCCYPDSCFAAIP